VRKTKPVSKRLRDFKEIEAAKERMRQQSTEWLRKMASHSLVLTKAGRIAIREVLAECESEEPREE
jgi:hypothetical protein